MRTTLDIADDMFYLAKDYARRDKKTLGETVSDLLRKAVQAPSETAPKQSKSKKKMTESEMDRKFREMGFVTFPSRKGGGVVTNEMINRIREEEGI